MRVSACPVWSRKTHWPPRSKGLLHHFTSLAANNDGMCSRFGKTTKRGRGPEPERGSAGIQHDTVVLAAEQERELRGGDGPEITGVNKASVSVEMLSTMTTSNKGNVAKPPGTRSVRRCAPMRSQCGHRGRVAIEGDEIDTRRPRASSC